MAARHVNYFLLLLFISSVNRSNAECEYEIVESMPDGMKLKAPEGAQIIATYASLTDMVEKSEGSLKIASFYWHLTPQAKSDSHAATLPGRHLMDTIQRATARGVKLEVVLDGPQGSIMSNPIDVEELKKIGTVSYVNMVSLLKSGVMHSKFMIADDKNFYLGSSNFDWRSYTEIKEMGMTFKNCPTLAQDLDKIFRTYVLVANTGKVPDESRTDLKTSINMENPLVLRLRDTLDSRLFLAGSPPIFNGEKDWTGRTDDIAALLHLINSARSKISISVMNYSPRMEFVWPKIYWPLIDDALRRAATTRHVKVKLLFSEWQSTRSSEIAWYKSLNSIKAEDFRGGGIDVKLFKVPAFDDYQKKIPFARVKHDKYMVTDGGVYLGTSNWTPDYFVNSVGVSIVIVPKDKNDPAINATTSIVKNFQDIFDRDFDSEYAHELQ